MKGFGVPSLGKMRRQLWEEVSIVPTAGPAVGTIRPVGIHQRGMGGRQRLRFETQKVMQQIVEADPAAALVQAQEGASFEMAEQPAGCEIMTI